MCTIIIKSFIYLCSNKLQLLLYFNLCFLFILNSKLVKIKSFFYCSKQQYKAAAARVPSLKVFIWLNDSIKIISSTITICINDQRRPKFHTYKIIYICAMGAATIRESIWAEQIIIIKPATYNIPHLTSFALSLTSTAHISLFHSHAIKWVISSPARNIHIFFLVCRHFWIIL